MTVKKMSKIFAIVFIVMVVGGILLTTGTSLYTYYKYNVAIKTSANTSSNDVEVTTK